jgi:hypothetical protein
MKKLLAALTLALLLSVAVVTGVATASHDLLDFESTVEEMREVDPTLDPPPNDGKHDFVVAGFQDEFEVNWGVSAHSGPSGEEPFGHVSVTFPEGPSDDKQGRFRVTCVNVEGNLAAIGAVPTQAASNDVEDTFVFLFRDAGPGGGEGPGAAQLDGFEFVFQDPNECQNPLALVEAAGSDPIERGNILVHDVQP